MFWSFIAKHACDIRTNGRTDRQTDRQNSDPQDRASIAASRGKNQLTQCIISRSVYTHTAGRVYRSCVMCIHDYIGFAGQHIFYANKHLNNRPCYSMRRRGRGGQRVRRIRRPPRPR